MLTRDQMRDLVNKVFLHSNVSGLHAQISERMWNPRTGRFALFLTALEAVECPGFHPGWYCVQTNSSGEAAREFYVDLYGNRNQRYIAEYFPDRLKAGVWIECS